MSSEQEDSQKDVVGREKKKRCWFESIYTNPMPSLSILLSLVFFLLAAILGWAFFEAAHLGEYIDFAAPQEDHSFLCVTVNQGI